MSHRLSRRAWEDELLGGGYEHAIATAAGTPSSRRAQQPMFKVIPREWSEITASRDSIRLLQRAIFTHVAIASNVFLMATEDGTVLRGHLLDGSDVEEFRLTAKKGEKLHSLFLDPTGNHAVLSMANGETLLWHSSHKTPRPAKKIAGFLIESIAWNREEGEAESSGPVLLGASDGSIYEAAMEQGRDSACRRLHKLDDRTAVRGLEFEVLHGAGGAEGEQRLLVLASSANPLRFYRMEGGPDFETLFRQQSQSASRFQDMAAPWEESELELFSDSIEDPASFFALTTGVGVYCGTINASGPGAAVNDLQLVPVQGSPPKSLACSKYHLLMLYPDRLVCMSRLTEGTVFEQPFDVTTSGDGLSVVRDLASQRVWLATQRRLFEIQIVGEDRNVWQQLLARARAGQPHLFRQALAACKTEAQSERVRQALADHSFKVGRYEDAAVFYASTRRSFEEIALKFMAVEQRDALIRFLESKLERIPPAFRTQRTILCTWLTELHLDRINRLQADGGGLAVEREADALARFNTFLAEHREDLHADTVFHLISSHGRVEELVAFAELIEDYQRVVTHHIQRRNYAAAVSALRGAKFEKVQQLVYKFSPELMEHAPEPTVNMWRAMPRLEPQRLIPALVRYTQTQAGNPKSGRSSNQAVKFLKFCVEERGNRDPALHNLLVSLLAQQADEKELLAFLHALAGRHVFDFKYGLRVCTENRKRRACVHIYGEMRLFEEAVALALEEEVSLAVYYANKPSDPELRKKLWLQIARHVMEREQDVKKALAMLADCQVLRIEDVLPFFPDFVVIDDFKDQINLSLEEYNERIRDLRAEMDEFTRAAERIRRDIKGLRNRYGYVSLGQRCDLSGQPVLSGPFYIFPCTHVFLAEALVREACKFLGPTQREVVRGLWLELSQGADDQGEMPRAAAAAAAAAAASAASAAAAADDITALSRRDMMQQQLDELVAAECPLCGEPMIVSVSMPFVSMEEESEAAEWAL
mmetsp:Transcript_1320/g.3893  ORF Transcript_1320/g.3893 Transcript_1320/m.3893 type:complete len:989 (-) Transcript_1320:17-2983(-)